MLIKNLSLNNFRSWEKLALELAPVTVLIGQNGVGKTNVLEALWFLSTGKSWRTSRDIETIRWNEELSRLTAEVEKTEQKIKIELIIQRQPTKDHPQPKILRVGGTKKRLIDILGLVPTVLFSPEVLEILDGEPGLRRRFLDILLSQIDHKYALNLADYNRVIKNRNKLLQQIRACRGKHDELDFWDEKLAEAGKFLIEKRKEAIKYFNTLLSASYKEISGKEDSLEIKYKPSAPEDRFFEILSASRERDIEHAVTSYGPHRDDLIFILNKRDVTTFGSRGEFRSVILALKMAELEYLAKEIGERPILILDDIFSELDHDRRMHLAKIVRSQQTIITTTDLDHIEPELQKEAKIIKLSNE